MHLHAYSKANYQTNIQIPYAILHLYLALVFKLGSRNWSFGDEWETEPVRKNKTTFALMQGGLQHVALSTEPNWSVTDLGQNTIQDAFTYMVEVHLSRLSGLNKADHWAVKTGLSKHSEIKCKTAFDFKSAQQHRLATLTGIAGQINREDDP